ncbi:MAG: sigma-70 family RNA polymerase sigma factor [Chitinophagales bacterium]|nr:sigma-70 family RNA polymerase sigma factor [Chitinophagales bacterium]
MITETQLIRDCKRGKKSSQYLLVQRYSGMLLSVCQRYTRDEAMAKDVLQESLIRIFQHIDRFDPSKGSFEGWMRRIAIRRSIQWVQRSCFQHELTPISMPDKAIEVPAVYIDLEVADILQLVNSLPTGFRTVFNLFVIEGYSHKEIADLLGISENTSRSQLVRARKALQEKILTQNSDRYYVR